MSESKILTSEEVGKIEAHLKRWDRGEVSKQTFPVNWKNADALCATVRYLLSENEKQRSGLEVGLRNAQLIDRIRSWSKCAHAYPLDEHINNIVVENERLTRERNEALDQCAELHRQIAEMK